MCNASKHLPGCQCGFGPPFPPSYRTSGVTEWAEEVIDNPILVTKGLREAAWDQVSIDEFVAQYCILKNSELPRETLITRIRELLKLRHRVAEGITYVWIKVPLYKFGAPIAKGASVEYFEGQNSVDGSGWNLKVFGIGTADTTSVTVIRSRSWIAKAGTCKIVFVPIRLQVTHIAIYDGSTLIGKGIDAQVSSLKESGDEHLRNRGCSSLDYGCCATGSKDHAETFECLLSEDTSDAIHQDRRMWETDVAHEVSVSLGKVLNVSALAKVKRTRQLGLFFNLPSGHDYRAYLAPGHLWWEYPKR
jgi:hypothetical protein